MLALPRLRLVKVDCTTIFLCCLEVVTAVQSSTSEEKTWCVKSTRRWLETKEINSCSLILYGSSSDSNKELRGKKKIYNHREINPTETPNWTELVCRSGGPTVLPHLTIIQSLKFTLHNFGFLQISSWALNSYMEFKRLILVQSGFWSASTSSVFIVPPSFFSLFSSLSWFSIHFHQTCTDRTLF